MKGRAAKEGKRQAELEAGRKRTAARGAAAAKKATTITLDDDGGGMGGMSGLGDLSGMSLGAAAGSEAEEFTSSRFAGLS